MDEKEIKKILEAVMKAYEQAGKPVKTATMVTDIKENEDGSVSLEGEQIVDRPEGEVN